MTITGKTRHGALVAPEGPTSKCIDRANCAGVTNIVGNEKARKCLPGSHQIVPEPALRGQSKAQGERKAALAKSPRATSMRRMLILPAFWEVFGLASVPAVVVALICLSWTIWLIILTLAPNETVNFLVSTEDFDDGRFWMLVDQSTEMKVVVVGALTIVVVSYGHVVLKVAQHRPSMQQTWIQRIERRLDKWTKNSPEVDISAKAARVMKVAFALWRELTGFRGRNRKFWVSQAIRISAPSEAVSLNNVVKSTNVSTNPILCSQNLWLKLMDLCMQTLVLRQMMLSGAPLVIMISYTVFLVVHSAVFAVVLTARYHTALGEILIDSAFDLIATIVFPMLTLLHADMACDIDYESFRIYNEVLPPGSFERRARMIADPNEVAQFRSSFDALRVKNATDLFIRVGMNMFFSYRFNRVVEELVRQRATRKRASTKKLLAHQRHVPRAMSLLFVTFGIAVVIIVSAGVTRAQSACSKYPQCVTHAYWSDTNGLCPCLTLIDVDFAPKTFDDWLHPPNVTDAVRVLSSAGTLKTLQLVNRELTQLPDELRACDRLELLYVGEESLQRYNHGIY